MKGNVKEYVLADTCFWFGLLDPTDSYHTRSREIAEIIEEYYVIIPWPCLYELVNTDITKKHGQITEFARICRMPGVRREDDNGYREQAFESIVSPERGVRVTSLVDAVINAMVDDSDLRIDYLVTYNARDFRASCQRRGIEIFPDD